MKKYTTALFSLFGALAISACATEIDNSNDTDEADTDGVSETESAIAAGWSACTACSNTCVSPGVCLGTRKIYSVCSDPNKVTTSTISITPSLWVVGTERKNQTGFDGSATCSVKETQYAYNSATKYASCNRETLYGKQKVKRVRYGAGTLIGMNNQCSIARWGSWEGWKTY